MPETGWESAPKVLVLVDFSAIAYACWAPAERAQQKGEEAFQEHVKGCGACARAQGPQYHCSAAPKRYDAHQVLKTNLRLKLDSLVAALPVTGPADFVMVKDSHPKWKYDLYTEYKGKREDKYNPRPEAEAYLRECFPGMQWVWAPGQEADDAIATLVKSNKGQRPVVVVSGDKDLWQLYEEPRVRIMNPVTQKWLTAEKVAEEFHGLEPKHIRAAKAFWGDSSDNLPNCAPRQQKQLVPLIKNAGGDLLPVIGAIHGTSKVCRDHVEKNLAQVVKNWKLAGLNDDVDLEWK